MELVTVERVADYCRADSADMDIVGVCGDAAEKACARRANRSLFASEELRMAAIDAIPQAMADAQAAWKTATDAANAITNNPTLKDYKLRVANLELQRKTVQADRDLYGIVADDAIIIAVLLTAAHFYDNREEVITQQGAVALEVPNSAGAIMANYRQVGPL